MALNPYYRNGYQNGQAAGLTISNGVKSVGNAIGDGVSAVGNAIGDGARVVRNTAVTAGKIGLGTAVLAGEGVYHAGQQAALAGQRFGLNVVNGVSNLAHQTDQAITRGVGQGILATRQAGYRAARAVNNGERAVRNGVNQAVQTGRQAVQAGRRTINGAVSTARNAGKQVIGAALREINNARSAAQRGINTAQLAVNRGVNTARNVVNRGVNKARNAWNSVSLGVGNAWNSAKGWASGFGHGLGLFYYGGSIYPMYRLGGVLGALFYLAGGEVGLPEEDPEGMTLAVIQGLLLKPEETFTAIMLSEDPNKIIQSVAELAQAGDENAILATQVLDTLIKLAKGQSAKAYYGAKLQYLKELQGICPEGTQMMYFKVGGKVCSKCMEKKKKAAKAFEGKKLTTSKGGASTSTMNSIKDEIASKAKFPMHNTEDNSWTTLKGNRTDTVYKDKQGKVTGTSSTIVNGRGKDTINTGTAMTGKAKKGACGSKIKVAKCGGKAKKKC